MTVRTDVITIVRRMAKHISVLIQNKNVFCLAKYICVLQYTFLFCKTHLCFQSVGPVCWKHFWKDTNYLKNEIGISNIGNLKKIWNCAQTLSLVRIQYCHPPFLPPNPVSSCRCIANQYKIRGSHGSGNSASTVPTVAEGVADVGGGHLS